MRRTKAIPGFRVVGAIALMLLLSVACEPPLPTAEVQGLPTHTPTQLADASTPTTPPATPTPSEPEGKDRKDKETAVPTLSSENVSNVEPEAEKVVATAKADLMQRLGVTEEAIVVKSVEEMQWRDSSLGCPQPGMMYAQVITSGYRILLQSGEQLYEYHSAQGRDSAVLCPGQVGATPRQPPVDEDTSPIPPVAMARADLARRLKVDMAWIETVEVTTQRDDAQDLLCLTNGSVPESLLANQDLVQWISLSFKDNVYHYIALADLIVYCGQ